MLRAGHLGWRLAVLFRGVWESQMFEARCERGDVLSLFQPLEEMALMTECSVSQGPVGLSPFIDATAERVSAWEQQLILSECARSVCRISISPYWFMFPLHLCLKPGHWSRTSRCNLAPRLHLPPNDTQGSSLRQSCTHCPPISSFFSFALLSIKLLLFSFGHFQVNCDKVGLCGVVCLCDSASVWASTTSKPRPSFTWRVHVSPGREAWQEPLARLVMVLHRPRRKS